MLEDAPPAALAGHWDAALLQPIADLNQRMLEGLRALALAADPAGVHRLPRLVALLEEDWRGLEPLTLQRVALCPYLLMDAGFGEPACWEPLAVSAVRDAPAYGGYFAGPDGVALVRRTLLFAWHLARSNRLGARVLLGMNARSAERIGQCRLQDLEALAERGASWIAPRWQLQPLVWQQLFRAARRGPAAQLRAVQLRGLQLIAASCARPGALGA